MVAPTESASTRLHLLGVLVRDQRVALGYPSKEKAAAAVGLSHVPYRNVENGVAVSDLTYTKIELGFGMLPGSCRAVLGGADSIRLQGGGELISGARADRPSLENVEAEARAAIQIAIGIAAPDVTVGQAERLSDAALEELRKRGLLPGSRDSR